VVQGEGETGSLLSNHPGCDKLSFTGRIRNNHICLVYLRVLDSDPGFGKFADPDLGSEIFADPDPDPDPGLDFSKNYCYLREKSKTRTLDRNEDPYPDPGTPKSAHPGPDPGTSKLRIP